MLSTWFLTSLLVAAVLWQMVQKKSPGGWCCRSTNWCSWSGSTRSAPAGRCQYQPSTSDISNFATVAYTFQCPKIKIPMRWIYHFLFRINIFRVEQLSSLYSLHSHVSKLFERTRRQNLRSELVVDLHVFVPVISRCENGFTKATRIAGDAGEVDALKVILNVLFPVIHFSTQGTFKPVDTTALLQKPLYMQLQLLSACKSEQFK